MTQPNKVKPWCVGVPLCVSVLSMCEALGDTVARQGSGTASLDHLSIMTPLQMVLASVLELLLYNINLSSAIGISCVPP